MSEDSARADQITVADGGGTVKVKEETKESENDAIVAAPAQEPLKPTVSNVLPTGNDDLNDIDAEGESEAETWIQSPEKKGNIVDDAPSLKPMHMTTEDSREHTIARTTPSSEARSRKRKRGSDAQDEARSLHSSPLSSPRLEPRSSDNDSDFDSSPKPRGKLDSDVRTRRIKVKHGDSDEDEDGMSKKVPRKIRKRRPSDILHLPKLRQNKNNGADPGAAERRETRSATFPRQSSEEASLSPPPTARREHKRGASTQLTSGEFEKKRRGRPPLLATRRNRSAERAKNTLSDDSSSPPPNRIALHKVGSIDHDIMSPAKATGPRKWRDKNGRTFLSRACNNDDLESARARYAERPDDLNLADNAGNTPLQIAALEGFVDIVRFLLEKGCEVDTRNIDKETPLIDAVENGHLEVVKLLLNFGANPRLGNAKGDEPSELVPPDDENYEVIRKLLADAKEKDTHRRRSQDQSETYREGTTSRAASAASLRDSPPIPTPRSPPTFASSRRRTGRSESTRNDLLWQANTQDNLTRLAAKGDVQGVASILNILQKAETDSLIAAAKAGHEEVLQYLLGMGNPEPDPEPVLHLKGGFNTPMLAAIGRGHPDVVKLLVDQVGFDPTRRYRHKTYYEIAAERKGENWQKEHDILRTAHEKYLAGKARKQGSPRKSRDLDKQLKTRQAPRSVSPASSGLRQSSSPSITHRSLKSPEGEKRHKRSETNTDPVERRRPNVVKKDVSEVAVSSDHDHSTKPRPTNRPRRSQSDLPPPPNLDEITYRRRRLVTGKEHRRRRSALSDNTSSDGLTDIVEVKRDAKPSTGSKRPRSSPAPDDPTAKDSELARATAKKRRTILESSPEEARPNSSIETITAMSAPETKKDVILETVKTIKESSGSPRLRRKSISHHKDDEVAKTQAKSEVDKPAKAEPISAAPPSIILDKEIQDEPLDLLEKDKMETDDENSIRVAQTTQPATDEKAAAEESAAKVESRRKADEEKRKAEEAKAAEAAATAAEAERKAAEAAAVKARHRAEQEEAAAALLAKKKDEEERQERARKEVEERARRQQEEQSRQQQLETERKRRESLPIILSKTAVLLDEGSTVARSPAWLSRFLPLFTVRTRQLDPTCNNDIAEEEWIPNFQVAALLATKDLHLTGYTSLGRRTVSLLERECLWKVARNVLSYDYDTNAFNTSIKQAIQREESEKPKFMAMEELFWVRFSDFQDQVLRHPHLPGLTLRKQPISLRMPLPLSKSVSASPRSNGILSPNPNLSGNVNVTSTPKIVNGTSSPGSAASTSATSPFLNGNVAVQ